MTSLSLTAALLVGVVSAAQEPAPGRIVLHVAAIDRRGNPVADLRPGEFEVWVAGYRVPVEEVEFVTPATRPRSLVLVLDDIAVGPDLAPRIQQAARTLVEGAEDDDRISIVSLAGGVRTAAGRDRAHLLQAIASYRPQGFPLRVEDASARVLRLLTALAREGVEQTGRKTIVGIGAAWLFDTPLPPPSVRSLHDEWLSAMQAMAAAGASLYVIDPVGLRPLGGAAGGALSGAGDTGFAHETGGYAFLQTNDMRAAAQRILGEAGTYYVLRLPDPPVQRKADLRKVEVKVLRKDVTARARQGIPGGA